MANIITSVSSQRWWESEKPAQRIFRVAHQSSGVNWKFTWTIPALSPWRRHQRELRSQEQYLGANPWGNIPAVSDSLPHCIFKFSYKSRARGNWASGIERLPKHTAWPLPAEKDSFSGCVKGLQKAISTGGWLILRCCDAWVRICSLRWLLTGFLSHSHILVASPGVRHAYITFQTVVWAGTVGYAYVCSLLYKMNHCFRWKGSLKIKRHCLEFETSEFVKGLYWPVLFCG